MTDIPYLTHLREDLVTGIGQRRRRITRRRRAALVLTPLVLAATVLATSLPGGASPALAIDQDGDWIEIRIADAAASETQMESELQAAGINADIVLAPTTGEYVGQWTCLTLAVPALTDPLQMPDFRNQTDVTPEVLYLKRGFTDRLKIVIGRAPEAGEAAEQPSTNPWLFCSVARVVSEESEE